MPESDLALLTDAALAAGKIALGYWKQAPEWWEKPDGAGPVTEADLAVNAHLQTCLRAARPGYGWLSEESEDDPDRAHCEHVFIIDPIDGTRAFMAGEDSFATSVAIARFGVVTAAAVYLPALDRLYTASADSPALLNGNPIHVSNLSSPEGARTLTSKPSLAPEHWRGAPPAMDRRFRSSLAFRLCLVADGSFDAVLSFRPTWEWDIAAGALIVARAGGACSAKRGLPLTFNQKDPRAPGLLAANPELHRAFAALML